MADFWSTHKIKDRLCTLMFSIFEFVGTFQVLQLKGHKVHANTFNWHIYFGSTYFRRWDVSVDLKENTPSSSSLRTVIIDVRVPLPVPVEVLSILIRRASSSWVMSLGSRESTASSTMLCTVRYDISDALLAQTVLAQCTRFLLEGAWGARKIKECHPRCSQHINS